MAQMNTRQWALYEYLKAHAQEFVTQDDIAKNLRDASGVPFYTFAAVGKPFHDTTDRRIMTDDIRVINANPVIQKTIISTKRGIKIASEKELARKISAGYRATFAKLARVREMDRKANRDGQMRVLGGRPDIQATAESINPWRAIRVQLGIKQEDVCREIGINRAIMTAIENGQVEPTAQMAADMMTYYRKGTTA